MEAAVIVTYRCNARCHMCNTWQFPTRQEDEISPRSLEGLPSLDFCNITGGEPFLRSDIDEIVGVLKKKAKRIVISTNGFFTGRILALAEKNRDIGIRISIEGLPAANDELRGIKNGFDHGIRSLLELQRMGLKDIGFGITVSDKNAADMIELYQLAHAMGLEFATAAVHNSFYFHKHDNVIKLKTEVMEHFAKLVRELLGTKRAKNWFRAYFNYGLMNYVDGGERLLPCEAGTENFFVTPAGEVLPCNGSSEPWVIGNIKAQPWDEIWNGSEAVQIRQKVKDCKKNCWMIGTAAPVMKKHIGTPVKWVIRNKLRDMAGRRFVWTGRPR